MLSYLSWDGFAISTYLIAHAAAEHLDADIEFALGTVDHFHLSFFARVSKANEALEAKDI